jgi:hypothetical protein
VRAATGTQPIHALAPVASHVWETSHPLVRFGVLPLGHRMTVIRRPRGGLLLHSPVPWTPDLARELDELGPVETIVAPSLMHDLWLEPWIERHPRAEFLAPRSFRDAHPFWPQEREIVDAFTDESDIAAVAIAGMPRVRERVLLHLPTRTLIVADLLMNLREPLPWVARWLLRANGISDGPGCSRLFRSMVRERDRFRRSLIHVLRLGVERIVPGHGAIIERDGHRVLAAVLGPLTQ